MAATRTDTFPHLKLKSGWGVLLGILAVIMLGLLAFVTFQPIQVLPRMHLAPGYVLTDQDGRRFTSEDLRGRFVLYDFSFSACQQTDACPSTQAVMQEVQQRLGEAATGGIPVALVTISFDAQRDDPAALRAYAQAIGANTDVWRFATADADRLKSVVGSGFGVYYNQEEDGSFTYSPTMILVDGWGIVRAVYHQRTTTPKPDDILRHMGVLTREVENSKGVARLGYEAAHLFLCYAS